MLKGSAVKVDPENNRTVQDPVPGTTTGAYPPPVGACWVTKIIEELVIAALETVNTFDVTEAVTEPKELETTAVAEMLA